MYKEQKWLWFARVIPLVSITKHHIIYYMYKYQNILQIELTRKNVYARGFIFYTGVIT